MAHLYRRKRPDGTMAPTWWAYIDRAGQKPLRESTGTDNKQLAQKWMSNKVEELWKEQELGIAPDKLFKDFIPTFIDQRRKQKECKPYTLEQYEQQLGWWAEQFKGKHLREITQKMILEAIKLREPINKNASLNRYLAVLRGLMRLAHLQYSLIPQVPTFFMYVEPKARVRYLKPWEIVKLLDALPAHLRDMAEFSLATGLRQSNVRELRWSEVDLASRRLTIPGIKMKNGEQLALPMSQTAFDVISKQIGKHPQYVFTHKGRAIQWIQSKTWKAALDKAEIENFRWHDLRHTWATMLIQAGVPAKALQALGAWETPAMVDKYAHQDTDSLRPYADVVDAVFGKKPPCAGGDVQKPAQGQKNGDLEEVAEVS